MAQPNEITVFITTGDATCADCGEDLGRHAWIMLDKERRALCLACADLDHLVFLPAGDTALTRRARKRYERQGLLVEEVALDQAEQECLADAEARERRQERAAERRVELDREYVERFAARLRELYPQCPPGRELVIAKHACRKYSGRVGRSAAAKSLDATAIRLAVIAHVRHAETNYDTLLAQGYDRGDARAEVERTVNRVLDKWKSGH